MIMPRISLTAQEIDELISSYISARSKLQYQISTINQTIEGLKEQKKSAPLMRKVRKQFGKDEKPLIQDSGLTDVPAEAADAKAPRSSIVPGKIKKKEAQPPRIKKAAKPGKRVRRIKSEGYRLSDWDQFILNAISEKKRPLVNSELFEACRIRSEKENLNLDESQLQGKIARSLHKLSNKRKTLHKLDIPGRGYAYGLGEWFFAKSGKLKKVYLKGLQIPEE
jgi:hypothetical protein